MVSDPSVRAAERPSIPRFTASAGPLSAIEEANLPVPRSKRRRTLGIYATLGVATIVVTLRLIASMLAIPLDTPVAGAAPTWMVEVTTMSTKPTTALVYGDDVGFQIVHIPAGQGNASEARVIPARLARGELHLMSLSLRSLHVRATAPKGADPMSFAATGPVITAYQISKTNGVRIGW